MTANVLFPGSVMPGSGAAIVLPLTALHRENEKPGVWVVDPKTSRVSLKPVTIGQYRENGVVIEAGLAAGDIVVTAGVNRLVAGQTVRALPAPASTSRQTAQSAGAAKVPR
jgi:multidrug efflux pump subunit AcrA (membrane-fusion protein)